MAHLVHWTRLKAQFWLQRGNCITSPATINFILLQSSFTPSFLFLAAESEQLPCCCNKENPFFCWSPRQGFKAKACLLCHQRHDCSASRYASASFNQGSCDGSTCGARVIRAKGKTVAPCKAISSQDWSLTFELWHPWEASWEVVSPLVLWVPPCAAQPYHWAGWELRDRVELHPERAGPAVPWTSGATLSDLAASLSGTPLSFTSHICPACVPKTTAPQQGPERAEAC